MRYTIYLQKKKLKNKNQIQYIKENEKLSYRSESEKPAKSFVAFGE